MKLAAVKKDPQELDKSLFAQILPCPPLFFSAKLQSGILALACVYGKIYPVKEFYGNAHKYLLLLKDGSGAIAIDHIPDFEKSEQTFLTQNAA